ncbi:acyltransferase [Pelosinus baikalensis]|uniref:Acyltransferase n=1 Tax=Pelosinus baikalensis TaxID=2892015 RepID=A0ABS8HLM4_9FIRM|nr:acyltransferase [Pelosinus baikalensis]MCC5464086.1 acyltransferase [Pelosinus baikalensis]
MYLLKFIILYVIKMIGIFLFKLHRVKLGKQSEINGFPLIINRGFFQIGDHIKLNIMFPYNNLGGSRCMMFTVKKNAHLLIGNNVGISNAAIVCTECIQIDDDVMIGNDCKIYDSDFHSLDYHNRITAGDIEAKSAPIHIKKGAFLGAHCIILKGVSIGEYSVIGAGSVVTKSVPDQEVWAGNPARFIKKLHA